MPLICPLESRAVQEARTVAAPFWRVLVKFGDPPAEGDTSAVMAAREEADEFEALGVALCGLGKWGEAALKFEEASDLLGAFPEPKTVPRSF